MFSWSDLPENENSTILLLALEFHATTTKTLVSVLKIKPKLWCRLAMEFVVCNQAPKGQSD